MDDTVGRKTRAAEGRMDDCRDWPPGRREHKWGLHRPEGLPMDSESGSAFTCLPRAPSSLGVPPKTVGEVSPRQAHHSACLRRETEEPLLLSPELRNDRWRAICRARSHHSWRTMAHWDPTHLEKSVKQTEAGLCETKPKEICVESDFQSLEIGRDEALSV